MGPDVAMTDSAGIVYPRDIGYASCSDAIKAQVRSRLSAAMVAAHFSRPPSYYSDDNYYKTLLNGRLKVSKRRMEKENQVTEGLISFAGEEISPHHIHDSPEVTQQRLERFLHRFHHVIHQYQTNLASGIYVGYTGREITKEWTQDMSRYVLRWKDGHTVTINDMTKVLKFQVWEVDRDKFKHNCRKLEVSLFAFE
jgi:hypothetical protein